MKTTDSPLKRFLFDCGTRETEASIGLALLRVASGLMMLLGHGLPKLHNFAKLKGEWHVPDFFPFYFMSPQLSLVATLCAEVLAAGLLVLGLMTRPAAFLLCFTMVVAAFEVNAAAALFTLPPSGKELTRGKPFCSKTGEPPENAPTELKPTWRTRSTRRAICLSSSCL